MSCSTYRKADSNVIVKTRARVFGVAGNLGFVSCESMAVEKHTHFKYITLWKCHG